MSRKEITESIKLTDSVLDSLAESLEFGASVGEACSLAGISRDTFYHYFMSKQDFAKQMEGSRFKLTRKAKDNIAIAIGMGDIDTSKWLLDKKVFPKQTIANELLKSSDKK